MAIVIRPVMERQREFDITQRLVAAIAEDLRRLCGTNRGFHWRKAERRMQQIVSETRAAARLDRRLIGATTAARTPDGSLRSPTLGRNDRTTNAKALPSKGCAAMCGHK